MKSPLSYEKVVPKRGDSMRRITRLIKPSRAADLVQRHIGGPKKRRVEYENGCQLVVLLDWDRPLHGRPHLTAEQAERLAKELLIAAKACKQHRYDPKSQEFALKPGTVTSVAATTEVVK